MIRTDYHPTQIPIAETATVTVGPLRFEPGILVTNPTILHTLLEGQRWAAKQRKAMR